MKESVKSSLNLARLGSILKTSSGGTPLKMHKEYYENGNIPWLLSGEIGKRDILDASHYITELGLKNSSAKVFPKNTVLVAMYGATAGEVGILRFESSTNQAVCGIYPDEKYLSEYLYYYFLYEKKSLVEKAVGNAQPNISQIKIKDTLIPVIPIVEQQRIVSILDDVFKDAESAKEIADKNLEKAERLFESYLNTVFCKENPDFQELTLSAAFTINPPKSELKNRLSMTDLISFVPMECLKTDSKYFSFEKERRLKEVIKNYTYFRNDDVLLAKITPCFENGKLGIANKLSNEVGFGSSEYIVFRANSTVTPEYLYYFLHRRAFLTKGAQNMHGAAGHKRVSKDFINNYVISFPKSLDTQRQITAQLDLLQENVKKLKDIFSKKTKCMEDLKESVLNKAFRGEL